MLIRADDASLHVRSSGDANKTLILVHGLGGSAATWERNQEALSEDFRVWIPELRGCGQSERGTAAYTLERLGKDLGDVVALAAKDGPVIALGHSLGGVVVQALLKQSPSCLDAAIFVSTSSRLNEQATKNWLRIAASVEKRGLSSKPESQARAFSETYALANPEMLERLARLSEATDPAIYAEQARAASSYNFDEALEKVSCPSLVIQGTGDRMTAVGGSVLLSRSLPNSTLELVEGAGHNLHMERPEEFLQLVRTFIQTNCK